MLKEILNEEERRGANNMADSYFDNFMKECLRDLKRKGETIVFSEDHINYIKEIYQNISITKTKDNFFKIIIDKSK